MSASVDAFGVGPNEPGSRITEAALPRRSLSSTTRPVEASIPHVV
jgi:hypothetical protein